MACRGCVNLQCNCFTASSETTKATGNGSQYAPFTFRPDNIPTPRPWGNINGSADQSLDGAVYSLFSNTSPDLDQGGNMVTGNGTNLTARADGLYLVGISAPFGGVATADLNDTFSLRRNGIQVTSVTYAHVANETTGQLLFASATTLQDLKTGDLLDLYVDRVAGAGTVSVDFDNSNFGNIYRFPRLWAIWLGGGILP